MVGDACSGGRRSLELRSVGDGMPVARACCTQAEVPQVRFYTATDLLSGGDDGFGYQKHAAAYELTSDTCVVEGKTYHTRSGFGTSANPTCTPRSRAL